MMPKNLLLLSMLLLVFSGCYDSLTEADLCNPNFEDCSQYESNSSRSSAPAAPAAPGMFGEGEDVVTGEDWTDAWDDHGEAENSTSACADGDDNDGDGYIDCDDEDCEYTDTCQAVAFEGDESTCSDGIDNDGDGYIDCNDFSCEAACEPEECLAFSKVSEECVFNQCGSQMEQCAEGNVLPISCSNKLICLMTYEHCPCCATDTGCLLSCTNCNAGDPFDTTMQGLVACISSHCSN